MNDRWSKKTIALHWLSAAFIAGLVVVGFVMTDLPPDAPQRRLMGLMHSVGGMLFVLLTIVRLVVRKRGTNPEPLPLPALHRKGVGAVHALIYGAIFVLGASGIATALGSTWRAYVWGDELAAPALGGMLSRQVHGVVVIAMLVLIGAHVGGVLLQQLKRGGVLRRMWPFPR